MSSPWCYDATLSRVIDGDTVVLTLHRVVLVDFGFRFKVEMKLSFEAAFRLAGIDTPELHGKGIGERTLALKAKQHVENLLCQGLLKVVSEKPIEGDKYGRWLVTIQVHCEAGDNQTHPVIDVAADLISVGLALPYTGKGPKPPFVLGDAHNG